MAYISRFNFGRLVANRETTLNNDDLTRECNKIYADKDIDWFSDLEKKRLFLCKILLTEPNNPLFQKIICNKWIKIQTTDNFKKAKKPREPRFHRDKDCEWLNKDYENYNLPANFLEFYKTKGVEEFRLWFKTPIIDHRNNEMRTPEDWINNGDKMKFLAQVETKWNKVSWSNFEKQFRPNSGRESFDNWNLKKIEEKIDQLLSKFDSWYLSLSEEDQIRINKIKNKNITTKEDLEIKFKKEFRFSMKDLLLTYYYATAINSNIPIENTTILEKLGFKPCKKCYPNTKNIDITDVTNSTIIKNFEDD
ncbi:Uncharacterised protein [Neisseria animaloris]|uniref:hypothetical protein n=1 Tax=Neisseria animaloris TaxID=326522 RepID=UPI000A18CBAD|nr:hypothetical protein [Neisseria animaloris]OSI07760.1 hypothetical protein BWD08_06245 [Neisseria animaloris]VEH88395.1 Uncharacterised protein [Neisseria animaloris]